MIDYNLNVVSLHPQFHNKTLKKYAINGIETVGAWGDEKFEILFQNNTWNRVQVKLSLDGTDILTGNPADTNASGSMWSCAPYQTLRLKAWPETNRGGAEFIFTSADKSVALHTHGDLSSKGIIAAAVFIEGQDKVLNHNWYDNVDQYHYYPIAFNATHSQNGVLRSIGLTSLDSSAAIGAGNHVEQNIKNVAGFVSPQLSRVVRIRYDWWDNVVQACKENGIESHGTGFPGSEKPIMSIGSTPRVTGLINQNPLSPMPPVYTRF